MFLPFLIFYTFLLIGFKELFMHDWANDFTFTHFVIGALLGMAVYCSSWIFLNPFYFRSEIIEAICALVRQKLPLSLWMWTIFSVSLEEVIWRLYAIRFAASQWGEILGLTLCSLLFTASHSHLLRLKRSYQLLELLLFALVIGQIWIMTNSLLIVIVIHMVRNIGLRKIMMHRRNPTQTDILKNA
jgi:membrane protease YdiL (CAAX protease family)